MSLSVKVSRGNAQEIFGWLSEMLGNCPLLHLNYANIN